MARNNTIFKNKKSTPKKIVEYVFFQFTNWQIANRSLHKIKHTRKRNRQLTKNRTWIKPPQGWCKINFDASITPSKAVIDFICRDSDGKVLFVGKEEIYQT